MQTGGAGDIGSEAGRRSLPSSRAQGGVSAKALEALTPSSNASPAPARDTFTFTYDSREGPRLSDVRLKGSFDPATGRWDPLWNGGRGLPMVDDGTHGDAQAGDGVYTARVSLDVSEQRPYQWGVEADVVGADGRVAQPARWLMMTEQPPSFTAGQGARSIEAHLTGNKDMGVHRLGQDGVRFKTWSPALGTGSLAGYSLRVEICDDAGNTVESLPMSKDARTGMWTAEQPSGWARIAGRPYRFAARNAEGQPLMRHFSDGSSAPVVYADPYARYVQGPRKGLEAIQVDPVLGVETGWYDSTSSGGPDYSANPRWGRFSVAGHDDASRVTLRLRDGEGRSLTRAELLARLGPPALVPYDQATPRQRQNVDILKRWQIDVSAPVTRYAWLDHVAEDGTIDLQRVGDATTGTSWVTVINDFPRLVGLHYDLEVRGRDGIEGDANGDGVLQPAEARRTPYNDRWSDVIPAAPGNERLSLVRESAYTFQHADTPRRETDPRRFVIYEAHVGSFMGSRDNAHASTFADAMRHLDHVERLGANTVELLPVQEFGGKRDWGYTPDFMFAGADAYGFEMPREEAVRRGAIGENDQPGQEKVWVSGTDAMKMFVDEAHRRGLNVISDVVYNHVAGRPDAQNPLDRIDGDARSFYRWPDGHVTQTPWGDKPAYASQAVKDLYTANAVQQVTELGVDGIRFDFVQVLHNTGSAEEKREGMNTLRQINRTLDLVRPGAFVVAEDFTHDWLVAGDLGQSASTAGPDGLQKRGMGFDAVWSDSFHHTLLGAVSGSRDMDALAAALTQHVGVQRSEQALVYAHSHDEVGNSGQWVTRVAAGGVSEEAVMAAWPRAMGRTAAAITLTSAGVPMIWQGEEQLANNDFKHAMPSTWGLDQRWMSPDPAQAGADPYAEEKRGHFRFYHDLIALRGSTPALAAGTPVSRLYTHNADQVIACSREGGGDAVVVVSNFSRQRRQGYGVNLPPGRWEVALNSDDTAYGGEGGGTHGAVAADGLLDLPPGATLVLRRARH